MDTLTLVERVIATISPYLPTLKDPNVRALYDIIGRRLRSDGEEESLQGFSRMPGDSALVKRLLQDAVKSDPQFASELEGALQRVHATTRTTVQGVSAGREVGGVIGGHVAHGKRSVAGEGNVVGSHNRNVRVGGGIVLAVVIVTLVAFVLYWAGSRISHAFESGQLTSNSTCREFLSASPEEQLQAMREIGLDEHVSGIGSPLALPAISYSCGAQPDAKVGAVIAKFHF
jgi:hypothetical protein